MPTKQGAPQAAPAQALDRQPPDQMVLSTADGDALEAWLRSTRGTQTLREPTQGQCGSGARGAPRTHTHTGRPDGALRACVGEVTVCTRSGVLSVV